MAQEGPAWRPVTVVDVDLGEQSIEEAASPPGPRFILARLHTRVLGALLVPCGEGSAEAGRRKDDDLGSVRGESLRALLKDRFADQIRAHVDYWGCSPSVRDGESIPCVQAREEALATAPSASVVIATHDRPELLRLCVESILTQSHPPLEIIVVDNARTSDATERMVAGQAGWQGRVRYIREDVPGLGRAHNAALPLLRGDVVAITDDDVVVDRYWLASLLEAFVRDQAGCVTGPIVPLELQTREQSWVEQYGGFARGYSRRVFSLTAPPRDDPLFPFTAGRLGSGANMAFTRAVLTAIGGFDASLGAGTRARGGDDLAAFARTVLAGARIAYAPDALVRHRHHAEYGALRRMAHGYGVGLGAYLTSLVIGDPRLLPAILRRLPAGLMHLLSPDSPKNLQIERDYPRDLIKAERLGLLQGPLWYGVSRLDSRRATHKGATSQARSAAASKSEGAA